MICDVCYRVIFIDEIIVMSLFNFMFSKFVFTVIASDKEYSLEFS